MDPDGSPVTVLTGPSGARRHCGACSGETWDLALEVDLAYPETVETASNDHGLVRRCSRNSRRSRRCHCAGLCCFGAVARVGRALFSDGGRPPYGLLLVALGP